MSDFEKEILKFVKDQMAIPYFKETLNIFLCGNQKNDDSSIRFKIFEQIKDESRYVITFPEWLFSDLLLGKKNDLLTLEQELAKNVDLIIIPLEGPGAIAELGAFSSHKELIEKIIVINKKKYQHKPSFINQGPIRLIEKANKDNVVFYTDKEFDDIGVTIKQKLKHQRKKTDSEDLNNFFNLSKLIIFIIGIFQPMSENILEKYVKHYLSTEKSITNVLKPSLEILSSKNLISLQPFSGESNYRLSPIGHLFITDILGKRLSSNKIFYQHRTKVLYQRSKKKRYNFREGKSKILVANI